MKTSLLLLIAFFCVLPYTAEAQCAMCRAVVESQADVETAQGLNNGIVYLMALPYVLVAALFYAIYRMRKQ